MKKILIKNFIAFLLLFSVSSMYSMISWSIRVSCDTTGYEMKNLLAEEENVAAKAITLMLLNESNKKFEWKDNQTLSDTYYLSQENKLTAKIQYLIDKFHPKGSKQIRIEAIISK